MPSKLQQEIKYLPGVGPRRAELFNKELNIFTLRDLLYYFPYRHIDRSKFYRINELTADLPYIQVKGQIMSTEMVGLQRKKRLVAYLTDGYGTLELIWFNGIKWVAGDLQKNVEYIVFGKPSVFNNRISIIHPEMDEASKRDVVLFSGLQPMYSTTERLKNSFLNSRFIHKLMSTLLQNVLTEITESLPDYLIRRLNLIALPDALANIHFPQNAEVLKRAEYRLKFEELFFIQLSILKLKVNRDKDVKGFIFPKVGDYFNSFYQKNLPFQLTEAQKRVMKEIRRDMGAGKQMNRLLQGDVGSGKTLVALMSMLIAIDNGFQTCIMAPTEILAQQHYLTILKFLQNMNVSVKLLTGSTKKSERKLIDTALKDGSLQILIGTHALIEDTVDFKNLGLVIIDEQHRFGVAQRARLRSKNVNPPHVLVMTATPIPRTLAMTIYGDLDVSVIDELPPGRMPIKTVHYFEKRRAEMYQFMKSQIAQGHQVYIVYPLIRESEKLDYKALEEGYEQISKVFPPPAYRISIVHGKMKPSEKDAAMTEFKEKKTQIMVATTVIEVGVDIPNASVMVIENAERFGLSQLHQLRGRVGRGAKQSFCMLMSDVKLTHEARKRIDIMVDTNNGFEIAEADLKLRGPGDIEGTQQSGTPFDLRIASIAHDGQILQYARDIATEILDKDPNLTHPENAILQAQLKLMRRTVQDWSTIS